LHHHELLLAEFAAVAPSARLVVVGSVNDAHI